MKAPVWALLARIDIVGGSTGWHRFKIVDNLIRYFDDWWLLGSNRYWTWDGGDDMWDLANQYVAIGATAGLLPLLSFLTAIVLCFTYLGNARQVAYVANKRTREWHLWLLGVTLFSNVIVFFGISYFDQTQIYWYALLAIIVTMAPLSANDSSHAPPSLHLVEDSWQPDCTGRIQAPGYVVTQSCHSLRNDNAHR
ncbi:MAG: hypothetical protein IT168_08005 [Bryobacterales bacterium]|nr:hypothetical protein [Bryobacterales bacterium]